MTDETDNLDDELAMSNNHTLEVPPKVKDLDSVTDNLTNEIIPTADILVSNSSCSDKEDGSQESCPDQKIKFEPGDHVYRWKFLKMLLWPIQIHGIVLSVEELPPDQHNAHDSCSDNNSNNKIHRQKIVIADFGFTRIYDEKDNSKSRNFFFGRKNSTEITSFDSSVKPAGDDESTCQFNTETVNDANTVKTNKRKRFHVITITDPHDINQWFKVNYGASLMETSSGTLKKIKGWFSRTNTSKANKENEKSDCDNISKHIGEISITKSLPIANQNSYNFGTGNRLNFASTALEEDSCTGLQKAGKFNEDQQGIHDNLVLESPDGVFNVTEDYEKEFTTLEQMISEAKSRQSSQLSHTSNHHLKSTIEQQPGSDTENEKNTKVNFFSKLLPKINNFNGSTRGKNNKQLDDCDDESTFTNNSTASKITKSSDTAQSQPKLPKSDPNTIVLARTLFLLEQENLSDEESCLPPYNIVHCNSECLAVWCKTGRFSTLQAAVFLHSTAVCNTKSTILLGATVSATQPWLIPVVGMYGIVAVGAPYVILQKSKAKWKEYEEKLTSGFWMNANPDVFISAIENWSGISLVPSM